MPLFTLFAGASARAYGFMQSLKSTILDTFTRSNTSGGPGIATDGTVWKAIRGTMFVSSNLLTTSDSPSNYPMVADVIDSEDAKIEVTASNTGQMAALWVTDSNNWWGVQTFSQSENCNCYSYTYSCNCYSYSYSCNCGSYSYSCNCYSGSYCAFYSYGVCLYYQSYSGCDTCYGYSCSTCYGYACDSCTGYSCSTCYPNYMRVLNSVSGSVSVLTSWAISSLAAAFRVKTSGNQITAQAYSNADFTGQIGSDNVYTATSPVRTKKFGLSIGPSSYNQGTTISKVSITKNS